MLVKDLSFQDIKKFHDEIMIDKIVHSSRNVEGMNSDEVILFTTDNRVSMPLYYYQVCMFLTEYVLEKEREFQEYKKKKEEEKVALEKEISSYAARKDKLEMLLKQSEEEIKRINESNRKYQTIPVNPYDKNGTIESRLKMLERDHKIIRDALGKLGYL